LQQLGLAAVPAIERAHAHSGPLGDSRDRRICALRGEDVARGIQYGQVVAPSLGLPAAVRKRAPRA
jgi:hypothetical protein